MLSSQTPWLGRTSLAPYTAVPLHLSDSQTGQKNRQVVVDASEEAASTPTKVLRSGKRLAATPAPAAVKTGGKQLPTKSTTKLGRTAKDARSAQQV